MKIARLRLQQEINKSFIVHNEVYPYAPWHHHPEYELVLELRGRGKRFVGDSVDRFEENDLVFTGPYLPHQWLCDEYPPGHPEYQQEKAFVIQFSHDFLGEKFFEIPENASLMRFLLQSVRGYKFYGKTREKIMDILLRMKSGGNVERLYGLFSLFEVFSKSNEYYFLSSAVSVKSFMQKENEAMHKALQYILQNFQHKIQIKDLLEITNMSYASFYSLFKRNYNKAFKDYLLDIRIEYACKLLEDESLNISEIAYNCGFENLSNFNRQFRRIKNITPSQFQKQVIKSWLLYA